MTKVVRWVRCIAAIAAVAGGMPALAQNNAPSAAPPPSAAPVQPAPVTEVDTRHALAKKLVKDGQPEKAVEEYVWLWENTLKVDPAKAELRASFMASEMEHLASQNAPAKARFVALRDDAEKRMHGATTLDPQAVDDILLLNRIVADQDRSLAWFDKAKLDPAIAPQLPKLSQRLEQLLEANARWIDLSTYIYIKPSEIAQAAADQNHAAVLAAAKADPGKRDMLNVTQERSYNARMSRLYASLLVAKRDAEADQVLVIAAPTDSTGRTVLACITKALDIGEARIAMRKPLDDAWKKGAGIKGAREKLGKMLKNK